MEDWEKELIPVGTAVAPDEDWESQLEPVQTPPAAPPSQEFSNTGQGEAVLIGLRSGATKGWDARAGAWLQEKLAQASEALPRLPPGNWTGIENYPEGDVAKNIYDDALQSNFRQYDAAVKQYPKTVGATELVGDIGSELVIAAGTGGVNLTPAGQALMGGIEGAGRSRSDLLSADTATNVGVGAGLGGLFGVAGKYLGPKKTMAAGAGLSEGMGWLGGESPEEATKRRTQTAIGLGAGLSTGVSGWLRSKMGRPFSENATKAMGEVREGLVNKDAAEGMTLDKAFDSGAETRAKALAKTEASSDDLVETNRGILSKYQRGNRDDAEAYFNSIVDTIQGATGEANKVRQKALNTAESEYQSALGKHQQAREAAVPAVEKATDDTVEANMKALAKAASERRKAIDERLDAEGKKRIDAEKEADKALVQAFLKEEAAKRVKANLDAGEEPDPADLSAISDLDARAIGILGNKVQEVLRYLRSQPALEPHGFTLDDTAKKGLAAVLPDYAAKGNAKLGEFAEGKDAMLARIKAELAAQEPAAKSAGKGRAAGGAPGEFDDEVRYMDPEMLAQAMPDPVDPKTKVPPELRARIEAETPEVAPSLEYLPVNPREAKAGALLSPPPTKVQPDLETIPGAQPEFEVPTPPTPRPYPLMDHLPVSPENGFNAPKFPGVPDAEAPARPFHARVADELQGGADRLKYAAKLGAVRAIRNPLGLATGAGLGIGGAVLGGPAGAAVGSAVAPGVGAVANMSRRAERNPNTLQFKDPAAAFVFNDKIARVLTGNPALRNRLQTFLAADNADVLAARVNYLLENDPEFMQAWAAGDGP